MPKIIQITTRPGYKDKEGMVTNMPETIGLAEDGSVWFLNYQKEEWEFLVDSPISENDMTKEI